MTRYKRTATVKIGNFFGDTFANQQVGICYKKGSMAVTRPAIGDGLRCEFIITHLPTGLTAPLSGYSRCRTRDFNRAKKTARWWNKHIPASGEFGVTPAMFKDKEQSAALQSGLRRFIKRNGWIDDWD